MRFRRFLRRLLALLVLAVLGVAAVAFWWLRTPLQLASPTVELSIEPGTTPRDVAVAWVAAGVRTSPLLLYEWFRWSGQARRIRAGSYEIDATTTPYELLRKIVQGDETLEQVRFIDGWTFRQLRAELAKAPHMRAATANLSDAQVMERLGALGVSPEGRFFPDTYAYSHNVSDLTVLKRAHQAMHKQIQAAWRQRGADSPLRSVDDLLILASIVEKETGTATDRARVAGVFTNRLRLGMPLQTDPTVIYGLGERFDGTLRKRDLLADTPLNPYPRAGLPPTPIAMPGRASLLAAAKPEATKALYFVSRGDGSSEFSETLSDHNRAVNRYQRGK